MRRTVFTILALCITSLAQPPASTPPQAGKAAQTTTEQLASREDIVRLFAALRLEKTVERVQAAMMANVEQMFDQLDKGHSSDLAPEQQARIDAFRQRNRERTRKLYPIAEMIEDFIPIYQKHFSKADVQAVIAFYESPVGQRLLDSQPELMQEGMAVLTPKLQQRMRTLQEEIQRDAEETLAPGSHKEPASAPPENPKP